MLVSLILTKLPKDLLIHLTDQKPDGQEWTVKLVREKLHRYITNRENAERQSGIKSDSAYCDSNKSQMLSQVRGAMTTTETTKLLKPAKERPVSIVKENIGVMNARNLPLW